MKGKYLLLALTLLLSSQVQALSCMEPPSLEEVIASADAIFIARVTSTSHRGWNADYRVERFYRGNAPLAGKLEIAPPSVWFETDRMRTGQRYLVFYSDGTTPYIGPCMGTFFAVDDELGQAALKRVLEVLAKTRSPRKATPL